MRSFLSKKGIQRSQVDYWTPIFIGGVFEPGSYPVNRNGKLYEIRGLTIAEGTITNAVGTFVFNNGDMVVFNSQGVLVEILGDTDNAAPGGGGSSTLGETWTPGALPGTNVFWDIMIGGNGFISNAGHTISATNGGTGVGSQIIFPTPNTGNIFYGQPFKVSDPNDLTFTSYIGFIDRIEVNPLSHNPTVGLTVVIGEGLSPDSINIMAIGNMYTNDNESALNSYIDWTPEAIYTLGFDPTAGTYGTIYLYSSISAPPNSTVATYALTEAIVGTPNCFMTQFSIPTGTLAITIENIPGFTIPGVTFVCGGQLDEASLPTGREGNAYVVSNLVNSLYIPSYGTVVNGDMVFFDQLGSVRGKTWTPDELDVLIPDVFNGSIGLTMWAPTENISNLGHVDTSIQYLPVPRANRTFQILNMTPSTLIWDFPISGVPFITINNGDIIGFNSESDIILHLSASNLT